MIGVGGVLAVTGGLMLRSRVVCGLGLVAAFAGGGLYARLKLAERREKIEEAERDIRAELDDLDPVARAQVLKDIVLPGS
ncbi:MAG TPA: hypothetical protein VE757_09330 [Gaiellaceae bacterium]|nr:hypothetical protein [Gaiellaceae bacterium]